MGRRRVAMDLIAHKPTRRKTFKMRKECLLKKAHEFKTLCGVHDTCVIIYDPYHEESRAPAITTYPNDPDKVMEIIGRYHRMKNKKKNVFKGLSDFFETRNRKMEKEINKSLSSSDDDELLMMIRSLSWQQLKSLDYTLAARHLMATEKLKTRRRRRRRRRIYKAVEPDKYHHHIQYSGSCSVPISPLCEDIIHQPQPAQDQYCVPPIGTFVAAADLQNDILLLDYTTAAVCNTTMPFQPLIHYQASSIYYQ